MLNYKQKPKQKINSVFLDGDLIYLKKDFLGWHVIHPWKNPDGKINWFNFFTGGSWWHLLIMVTLVLIISLAIFEYTSNMNILISCFDNPIALENCKESFGFQDYLINP